MGRIRLAYPHRRSQVTARLGSFLLKVESGAERVVARALGRFRSKPAAPRPLDLSHAAGLSQPADRRPAADPDRVAGEAPPAIDAKAARAPSGAVSAGALPNEAAGTSRPLAPPPSSPVAVPERARLAESELPASYGRSRAVVLPIDPYHVHAYWEVTPADAQAARARLAGSGLAAPTWVLRFHDVTRVPADIAYAHGHFDVEIDLASRNWYVELWSPDKTYLVELGARLRGEFSALCRANPVTVPPAELSPPQEPEWRIADPERGTTQAVAASDPRLPRTGEGRAAAPAPMPDTARSPGLGVLSSFDAEQPWVLASRGLDADPADSAVAGEVLPASEAPATRAATPQALPFAPASEHGRDHGSSAMSRSVSLLGLASGSGGSHIQGGDSNE